MNIVKTSGKGALIIISGPSGCGKASVIERLKEYNDNFWVSVSCTTRKPRIGEEDGITYYFKTKKEFEEMIKNDELVEYNYYNDNYYGTPKGYIKDYQTAGQISESQLQRADCRAIF